MGATRVGGVVAPTLVAHVAVNLYFPLGGRRNSPHPSDPSESLTLRLAAFYMIIFH